MKPPVFGAVADDDTGATDLAGMLAEQGLRTLLIIDVPDEEHFNAWARDYDAVIIGAGTRALKPHEAYDRTREGVRLLARAKARVIEIKYCSTFDSTAEGNIGPSIDAGMDELNETFTVALPALPVNGRTTYMGHHFVHGQLLSDSPMSRHPLTPMRDSNLVRHLQSQTRRKVGLAQYPVTGAALQRLQVSGTEIAVLDCIGDDDLTGVCEAIADLRFISGSSAPAMKLATIWSEKGWWSPAAFETIRPDSTGRGTLIVAGSCSEATRRQNEWLETRGVKSIRLDAAALAAGEDHAQEIGEATAALQRGDTVLIRTASGPANSEAMRVSNETGLAIAYGLAAVVRSAVERALPACLIVAGGETSGAVCRTLKLGALEVGRNIEPGVPLCIALGRFRIPVVLKSGNFGGDDFYGRAEADCKQYYV